MHYDIHMRSDVRERLADLAETMRSWEVAPRVEEHEAEKIGKAIRTFSHTTRHSDLRIGGVDGSGDYPAVRYGDSFVYVVIAQATCYGAEATCGLREVSPGLPPVLEFVWLPEDEARSATGLEVAFQNLAGMPLMEVLARSDYRAIKANEARRDYSADTLYQGLIRPQASDAGNIELQLRSAAEMGAALRLLQSEVCPQYLLIDTTLSLPFVQKGVNSLFYEHLKRLCCVVARQKSIGFFALSRSHGLPGIEAVEEIVRETQGRFRGEAAEHWYLRIPTMEQEGWTLSLSEGRRLPPPGAVSYLVRFHRTTPTLRLDMDSEFWAQRVRGATEEETRANERKIFEDLDYSCHDQRCYGIPYPMHAGHERASLTRSERTALRQQIIDAGVKAGMKRSLFRKVSATEA